eukprot:4964046-Prymnesium_polylepis.1
MASHLSLLIRRRGGHLRAHGSELLLERVHPCAQLVKLVALSLDKLRLLCYLHISVAAVGGLHSCIVEDRLPENPAPHDNAQSDRANGDPGQPCLRLVQDGRDEGGHRLAERVGEHADAVDGTHTILRVFGSNPWRHCVDAVDCGAVEEPSSHADGGEARTAFQNSDDQQLHESHADEAEVHAPHDAEALLNEA